MKLRIRGNALRLRLTRGEVDAVAGGDAVEETIAFAPGVRLAYALVPRDDALTPTATFDGARVVVAVPALLAREWAASDRVGIVAHAPNGAPDGLSLVIEKDFACLHRESENADAFPNPAAR